MRFRGSAPAAAAAAATAAAAAAATRLAWPWLGSLGPGSARLDSASPRREPADAAVAPPSQPGPTRRRWVGPAPRALSAPRRPKATAAKAAAIAAPIEAEPPRPRLSLAARCAERPKGGGFGRSRALQRPAPSLDQPDPSRPRLHLPVLASSEMIKPTLWPICQHCPSPCT